MTIVLCVIQKTVSVFMTDAVGHLAENIRQLINKWAEAYPEDDRGDLPVRLRSDFNSTFFELFIFTLFSRLGFELTPHPELENTLKRCDFEVRSAEHLFYLECISNQWAFRCRTSKKEYGELLL